MESRQRGLSYASGGFGLSVNAVTYLAVPLRADELGADLSVIGLLIGIKALVETLMSVPLGAFMDRSGPRRSLVIGTAGTAVVGVGLTLAPSIAVLFVMQAALGFVRPLGWVGGQSYVAGMRQGEARSHDTGRFSFCANLGQIVAPAIAGAAISVGGTRAAFLVVAALGLTFCVLGLMLPEIPHGPGSSSGLTGLAPAAALLRRRGVQSVLFLTFCRLWVSVAWSSFYPLHLVTSGVEPALAATVISVMGACATVTSLLVGWIARLGSPTLVTAYALAVSCLGLAVSPWLAAIPLTYVPAVFVGFGLGVSLPMLITLTSLAAPQEARGLALGLRSGVNQAAATLAPILVGHVVAATGLFVGFPVAAAVGAGLLGVAGVRRATSAGRGR